ncbi:MAG: MFS transporter [Caldisericia bacterium]|nr:MFS transporter [Caldisericia bacterium]MDD4614431.1 MFS transporter [Caldisericia bacterium]
MSTEALNYIRVNVRWNFIVNAVDEAFWVLSNNLASIITLLPVFIEKLGGSNIVIGMIPGLAFICIMLPGIISANSVENKPNKLAFVKKITLWERFPFVILALSAYYLAIPYPSLTIWVSIICVVLIYGTSGIIQPAWLGYIAKVTPSRKLGSYFAAGNGLGALLGIGGFVLAAYLLDTFAFPINYFLLFSCASVAVFISYWMLLLGREPDVKDKPIQTTSIDFFKALPVVLKQDSTFVHFIIVRNLQCLGSMATTFFTVYAIKSLHFADSSAGILSIFLASSQSLFFFVWGYIGDQKSHKFVLTVASLGLVSTSLILMFLQTWPALCVVFVMLGIYYSGIGCSGLALLHNMAPKGRYPTYIALYNALQVASAFIAPVLGGWISELYGWKTMFSVALVLSIAGLIWLLLFVHEKRRVFYEEPQIV